MPSSEHSQLVKRLTDIDMPPNEADQQGSWLDSHLQLLETGGGHGTLLVDAGAMLPGDTVPSGRRQEVESAIRYVVQRAKEQHS